MTKQEPIKITLDDLEEPKAQGEPEADRGRLHARAEDTGRHVAGAAKDIAAKVTDKLAAGAAEATSRSAEVAREKMSEALQGQSKAIADAVEQRVREIDWKAEAQKGSESGLRWLSNRLNELADRMKDAPTPSDATDKKPPNPES